MLTIPDLGSFGDFPSPLSDATLPDLSFSQQQFYSPLKDSLWLPGIGFDSSSYSPPSSCSDPGPSYPMDTDGVFEMPNGMMSLEDLLDFHEPLPIRNDDMPGDPHPCNVQLACPRPVPLHPIVMSSVPDDAAFCIPATFGSSISQPVPPRPSSRWRIKVPPQKQKRILKCYDPRCWALEFTKSNALKQHYRVHTKEQPFECEHCNRRFSLKCNLRRHYKTCSEKKIADAKAAGVTPPPASSRRARRSQASSSSIANKTANSPGVNHDTPLTESDVSSPLPAMH